MLGFPRIPHPDVQEKVSTQQPARPQSVAEMTVVGQKPNKLFSVSNRQSYPDCAVRGCVGSPVLNPQVDSCCVICLLLY
jgi:hypothetical protein